MVVWTQGGYEAEYAAEERFHKCCDSNPTLLHSFLDLPEKLWGYNAGFSCKSFSKLHNDWKEMQRALLDNNEESSSVKTFKAVLQCLESIDISWLILENVDLEIGPDSNYSIIMRSLEEVGPKYAVMAYKMLSSDFGLPQRRTRLYIVGVSRKAYPTFDMQAIAKLLDILKLPTQKPVDFMLPDQSSRVLLELNRREQYLRSKQEKEKSPDDDTDKDAKHKGKARGAGDKNVGDKWKSMHMELAEQRGLPWPLQLPKGKTASNWFQCMPQREQENIIFLWDDQTLARQTNKPVPTFGDLYHSAARMPTSPDHEVPTVLPGTKLWSAERDRLLLGRELLHLQGLQFDQSQLDEFTEHQLTDIAGNSFSSLVCLAVLASLVVSLDHLTESEEEEEDCAMDLISQLKRARHN